MFGLFGKKRFEPSVTPEDKEWVETNIAWLIETFGMEHIRKQPFIVPTVDNFPYTDLNDPAQFQQLFEQLCKYWDLDPNTIEIKFFDDIISKQWNTWVPHGEINEPGGLYSQVYTTDEKRFKIQLAKSNIAKPLLLIAVISHELAHVKLLGWNYINQNDADMEPLTDLSSIFFGFGVIVANTVQTSDFLWLNRSGYLPNQVVSYANALICYISGYDAKHYSSILNGNTSDLFKNDFAFLSSSNDTLLTKDKVEFLENSFLLRSKISEGFVKRDFESVIQASDELGELNPKDVSVYNFKGYALLQTKRYTEAIEQFTKAIDIHPYWDQPYNNRGYCKLQLDDLDNAYFDLEHSFEMNPESSYSWRNLGAYFLKSDQPDKALKHFEHAEKIDPTTELINFYLGKTHLKIGNTELAHQYLEKSKLKDEFNDSMFE